MSKQIEVFAGPDGWDTLLKLRPSELLGLVGQTAASLIVACESYPRNGSAPKESPIGKILVERMNWADHGFTNALLSQANFLYALVTDAVDRRQPPALMEKSTAKLVTDALAAFQRWKTSLCQAEQEEHGEHWGTATLFFQKDWTDHNEKFLTLWHR